LIRALQIFLKTPIQTILLWRIQTKTVQSPVRLQKRLKKAKKLLKKRLPKKKMNRKQKSRRCKSRK